MEFRLLGAVRAEDQGRALDLGPRRQRFVLAVLALEVNRPVPLSRLIELCWPDDPPRTAENAIMVCVSKLRTVLAGVELSRVGSGYVLRADPASVDVHRFRALVEDARRASDDRARVRILDGALALWTGPALDDAAPPQARDRLCRGLDEERMSAIEDRFDARLRLGEHRDVVAELSGVDFDPSRERLVGQQMLALHRSGRTGDALAVYRAVRDRLADELGIDPGPSLQQLERAILREEPQVAAPAPEIPERSAPSASRVPAELPPMVRGFAGRAADLAWLDAQLPADEHTPMPVTLLAGTAGVGKTSVAVHWAHRVRDRFPDGQLYVNLRGYDQAGRTRPMEALGHALRVLGVPAEELPTEPDAATALYRTILADRAVLILLDNAASAEQVRGLLPGSPRCLALITSRDRLGGLVAREGAARRIIEVLPSEEAGALLTRALGADRVAAEPHATAELAELCAHLPLALRIAAALLEDQPGRSIRDYVSELSGADRLTALTVAGDEQEAVRAAFDLSERSLPADTRRVFRLLGLVPGDVDADTVAALAGVEVSQARLALDRLTGANLLDVRPGGRYAPHDLLRLYARELAEARDEPADRQAAVGRVLTYYADGVDAAARRIYPHMQRLPRDPSAREFPTGAAAATWLDAERRNLVDAVLAAAAAGPRPIAWQLADGLRGFFWLRRHAADWLAVAEAGLRAATDDGDHRGQAAAHLSLGQVKRWLARHTEAVAHYDRACALSRAAGWADGEAAALGSLANVYRDQGRLAAAAEQYRQVAELAQRTGNRTGAAVTHGNLGNVYLQLGRLHEALTEYDQCLALSTELGSRIVANMALDGLGAVYLELGESEQALDHLARALAGHRGTGSREGEADAMVVMAEVHRRAGRSTAARADARAGLELAREAGVSRVEVDALTCLGILDQDRGRLTLARTLAVQTSYRYGETVALIGLAEIATDPGQARTEATRAADLARGSGFALLEARARLFLKDAAYFKLQPNGS